MRNPSNFICLQGPTGFPGSAGRVGPPGPTVSLMKQETTTHASLTNRATCFTSVSAFLYYCMHLSHDLSWPFLPGSSGRTWTSGIPRKRGSSWHPWRPWTPWETRRARTSRTSRESRRQRGLWGRWTHGKWIYSLRYMTVLSIYTDIKSLLKWVKSALGLHLISNTLKLSFFLWSPTHCFHF